MSVVPDAVILPDATLTIKGILLLMKKWIIAGIVSLVFLAIAGLAFDYVDHQRVKQEAIELGQEIFLGEESAFVIDSFSGTGLSDNERTFVLEYGLGSSVFGLETLASKLEPYGRVIRYERARNWYDPHGHHPEDLDRHTEILNQLLLQLKVEGRVVLVGFSMGGHYIRSYANRHPEKVEALIVIDSGSSEDRLAPLEAKNRWVFDYAEVLEKNSYLARFGLIRMGLYWASLLSGESVSLRALLENSADHLAAQNVAGQGFFRLVADIDWTLNTHIPVYYVASRTDLDSDHKESLRSVYKFIEKHRIGDVKVAKQVSHLDLIEEGYVETLVKDVMAFIKKAEGLPSAE